MTHNKTQGDPTIGDRVALERAAEEHIMSVRASPEEREAFVNGAVWASRHVLSAPEPADADREALVRDLLDEANHYSTPEPVADLHRRAVAAIRHHGPVTANEIEAAMRAHDYSLDRETTRAVLEAARSAR